MVDQRLDHMLSGALSPAGPRAYLVPSAATRWTSRPHTPVRAHSRIEVAAPVTSGTRERPWAVAGGSTPNRSHSVAWRSTLVVRASTAAVLAPGHRTSRGMRPSGSYTGTPGLPHTSFSPR